MPEAQQFFTATEENQIVNAIQNAEGNTSGEIRVHLDNSLHKEEWQTAQRVFCELRMYETALRNAVLFHISVKNNSFSIVADKGINAVVPIDFWDNIKNQMQEDFKNKQFTKGLCTAIESAGEALKAYFPFENNDLNELPNEISR